MKVFFIYILVFLFQLKTIIEKKKDKESQIKTFYQSLLTLSIMKTSYLNILFWKKEITPTQKQIKVVLSGTDMTISHIKMRIFCVCVCGGVWWIGCFFIHSHSWTVRHSSEGRAGVWFIFTRPATWLRSFCSRPSVLPARALGTKWADLSDHRLKTVETPGHKGEAYGAWDISKTLQLLLKGFNINAK